MAQEKSQIVSLRPQSVKDYYASLETFIREELVEGVDFTVLDGRQKFLNKAGAEKFAKAFSVVPEYHILDGEVSVREKAHPAQARQEGGASHLYTQTEITFIRYVVLCRLINTQGVPCGSGIGSASSFNPSESDCSDISDNTRVKMAAKRAFVAATLDAFALSRYFSQDPEAVREKRQVSPPQPTSENPKSKLSPEQERAKQAALHQILKTLNIAEEHFSEVEKNMKGKFKGDLQGVLRKMGLVR